VHVGLPRGVTVRPRYGGMMYTPDANCEGISSERATLSPLI
jgi:hypothetical protein